MEPRLGSHVQALSYCTKEETRVEGPWTAGEAVTGPGHRSDLVALQAGLNEGMTVREVSEHFFHQWMKYPKSIDRYIAMRAVARNSFERLDIFYGITGTGKSHTAHADNPGAYCFVGGTGEWYDGYTGQSTIILDEFDPRVIPYRRLLRLADRYPLSLPVKGGFVECVATRVVITHNLHPREWYRGEDISPLLRRATIRYFDTPYVPTAPPPAPIFLDG